MNHYITRKRFGQNLLRDSYIIEYIVAAIHPQPGQAMVEIGPGLGALTEPIASHIDVMTVIELDRNFASILATHPFMQDKLNILQQDAMTVDFSALSVEIGQPLRVFGNLPYYISTQLLFHLFSYIDAIQDMYFMLQKEVVNRLVAAIDSKAYGRLSVMAQSYCKIISVLQVPPASFIPAPKVDSVVVRLVPYAIPRVKDLNPLGLLTRQAFNQRRKTIRNSLGNLFNAEQLAEQGIDAMLRAENLSVEQYCRLANTLA